MFFKNIKFKKIIYPIIVFIGILLTIAVFIKVARFLVGNINKAFYNPAAREGEALLTNIDLENLKIIADKLGITLDLRPREEQILAEEIPTEQVPAEQAPAAESENGTGIQASSTESGAGLSASSGIELAPAPTSSLKIAIFNSTKITGLAGDLKKLLIDAGFEVMKIGDQAKLSESTVIKIKEDKKIFTGTIDGIREVVYGKYELKEIQTLKETSAFDVEIVIGEK